MTVEATTIDSFNPATQADFAAFQKLLVHKLAPLTTNPQFTPFFKNLCRELFQNLKVDYVQDMSSFFNVMVNEKLKKPKEPKRKKSLSLSFLYFTSFLQKL